MNPFDPRHGTKAGYQAHSRQKEPACDACRDAAARYERGRAWDQLRGAPRAVPAIGLQRRIQALMALGWPASKIGEAAGMSTKMVHGFTRNQKWVFRPSFEAIAEAYDRLHMTPGPSVITRRRAERAGWAPPLAWDDIDDPDETPQGVAASAQPVWSRADTLVDEAIVARILAGEYRLRSTTAERREVTRRWLAEGRSLKELRKLTGWKVERYYTPGGGEAA